MVAYGQIQRHIDKGRGIAARKLGPPYAAYRIVGTSLGDFPDGWTIVNPKFKLYERRYQSEAKFATGIRNTTLWYEIIADMTQFYVGDVFVNMDPAYKPGKSYGDGATQLAQTLEFQALCLAMHMPVGKSIGARIDRLARVYRPSPDPSPNAQNSMSWKTTRVNDLPLILSQGQYAFGLAGAGGASLVPIGTAATHKRIEGQFKDVPGMTKTSQWFVYMPPIPGYLPRIGDAIVDQNGTRYVVNTPWEQQTGVMGYQLGVDRRVDQADSQTG